MDDHHGALDRLLRHLDAPKSACAWFQPLFGRRIGNAEYGLALMEARRIAGT